MTLILLINTPSETGVLIRGNPQVPPAFFPRAISHISCGRAQPASGHQRPHPAQYLNRGHRPVGVGQKWRDIYAEGAARGDALGFARQFSTDRRPDVIPSRTGPVSPSGRKRSRPAFHRRCHGNRLPAPALCLGGTAAPTVAAPSSARPRVIVQRILQLGTGSESPSWPPWCAGARAVKTCSISSISKGSARVDGATFPNRVAGPAQESHHRAVRIASLPAERDLGHPPPTLPSRSVSMPPSPRRCRWPTDWC